MCDALGELSSPAPPTEGEHAEQLFFNDELM
jgi:hypothetical protein